MQILNNLEIPLNKLPDYISKLEEKVKETKAEIISINIRKTEALQDHDMCMATLLEYVKDTSLAEKLRAKEIELQRVKMQKENLEKEISNMNGLIV